MRIFKMAILLTALASPLGCGDDDATPMGTEGDPCYPNDTCNQGLRCLSGICVADTPCSEGSTQTCECPGGQMGTQVCQADHSWSDCDCPVAGCGDGVVEPPETCDGDCPTDCDDQDSCTVDVMTGSAQTCDVVCDNAPITECQSGDGCCVQGCDWNTDDDCEATCGNGIAEDAEACDGIDLRGATGCSDVAAGTLGVLTCGTDCQFASPPDGCCPDDSWVIETVDASNAGAKASLGIDSAGRLHISYGVESPAGLRYALWDGAWTISTLENLSVPRRTSLVVDSADRPHVLSVTAAWVLENIAWAHWDGTAWQSESMSNQFNVHSMHRALALDQFDIPHVVHMQRYPNMVTHQVELILRYTRWNGNEWYMETPTAISDTIEYASLALDSSEQPWIGYYDTASGILRMVRKHNGLWVNTPVESGLGSTSTTALALDAADHAHLSYYHGNDGALRYAYWNGATWQVETVDAAGDVGAYSSMALDAAGKPFIAYYDLDNGDLKMAYRDGLTWNVQTVDAAGDVGTDTSIVVSAAGLPIIAYHDVTNGALKVARIACP